MALTLDQKLFSWHDHPESWSTWISNYGKLVLSNWKTIRQIASFSEGFGVKIRKKTHWNHHLHGLLNHFASAFWGPQWVRCPPHLSHEANALRTFLQSCQQKLQFLALGRTSTRKTPRPRTDPNLVDLMGASLYFVLKNSTPRKKVVCGF